MDLGLKDKRAFVAASSDGLGKAVALELAKEGASVIINGRDRDKLEQTKRDIEIVASTPVMAICGDLSNEKERAELLTTIFNSYDALDILVTNTGGPPSGTFESLSMTDWDNTYNLLLASTVSLIKSALPGMKHQRWGRIIAITSQ